MAMQAVNVADGGSNLSSEIAIEEVTYFNKAEANKEKVPNVYPNFVYDNEEQGGGALNKFAEIGAKLNDIKNDVENLNSIYNSKLVTSYEKFSNFKEIIDKINTKMTLYVDNIKNSVTNIITTAKQTLEAQSKTDSSLIDDLAEINLMLQIGPNLGADYQKKGANGMPSEVADKMNSNYNKKYEEELYKAKHDGYSEEEFKKLDKSVQEEIEARNNKGKIVFTENDADPTGTEKVNTVTSDLEAKADEIIQGKYGNGPERFKELEAQGYAIRNEYDDKGNLVTRGLQDIVNEKLNGTWDSSKLENSATSYTNTTPNQSTEKVIDTATAAYPNNSNTDKYIGGNMYQRQDGSIYSTTNPNNNTAGINQSTGKVTDTTTAAYSNNSNTDKYIGGNMYQRQDGSVYSTTNPNNNTPEIGTYVGSNIYQKSDGSTNNTVNSGSNINMNNPFVELTKQKKHEMEFYNDVNKTLDIKRNTSVREGMAAEKEFFEKYPDLKVKNLGNIK